MPLLKQIITSVDLHVANQMRRNEIPKSDSDSQNEEDVDPRDNSELSFPTQVDLSRDISHIVVPKYFPSTINTDLC